MEHAEDIAERLSTLVEEQAKALRSWLGSPPAHDFGVSTRPVDPDPTFPLLKASIIHAVVTHFLTRACRNHEAVHMLCRQDHAVETQPILRASVESAIDLRYIATNPQTLCTKWALYEDFWRFRQSSTSPVDERPGDFGYLSNQVDKRLRQLNRHRPKPKSWRRQDLYRDWDLSSVAVRDELADGVWNDGHRMYDFYRLLSDIQHGNSMSIRDFVAAGREGYSVVHDLPNRKRVYVQVIALHTLWLTVTAARHCGASIPEEPFAADLGSLGLTREQLGAAASNDFRLPPLAAE